MGTFIFFSGTVKEGPFRETWWFGKPRFGFGGKSPAGPFIACLVRNQDFTEEV